MGELNRGYPDASGQLLSVTALGVGGHGLVETGMEMGTATR